MKSVLRSVPIHVLSAIVPPKSVIKDIQRIFAKIFWHNKELGRGKHWAAWKKICLPKAEGGLGFRSLKDVSQAMNAKLWWRFRIQSNLWTDFLWNKYCKKQIPTLVHWKVGSQVWKAMLSNRDIVEKYFWWEPRSCTSTIWFDNWTNFGPLFLDPSDILTCHPLNDIGEFLNEEGWAYELIMKNFIPSYVVEHVRINLGAIRNENKMDKP